MEKQHYYAIFFLLFILFIGCNKNSDVLAVEYSYDCEFVEISGTTDGLMDDTELAILKECQEGKLTSEEEIESNLIGEWELVGFGDGWVSHITQPCGYMKITKKELIFYFKNEYADFNSVHQWEIENLLLKVTPENPHLSMTTFCDQFMHGVNSEFGIKAIDVDQYIYEKIK